MARTFLNKTNVALNQGFIPRVEFKLFGQWDETIRVLNKLSPTVKQCSLIAQMKICLQICKMVKNHLKNQDLNWEPLSGEYAKRKEEAGLEGGTLIAYGAYYNNITAWQKGSQHFAFVGVKRGIYTKNLQGKRSRLDIATIAAVHEFSSGRRVPKRPLWNPTIAEIGGAPGLKKLYVKHLVGSLRVRGIPVKAYFNIF